GEDDSTPVEQLWYHVQLEGPGGFDFWTMSNSLTCWPAVGQYTLKITARDLENIEDPTPLVHNFSMIGNTPAAPTNLACYTNDDNHLVLSWSYTDPYVVGFTIWRDYSQMVGELNASAREFIDSSVNPGESHRYVVTAWNYFGWTESEPSVCQIGNGTLDPDAAEKFDYPVGYPDFSGDWYDAQNFGSILYLSDKHHSGNDLNKWGGDLGEPIYAPGNGQVVYKTNNANGWGKCLIISSKSPTGKPFRLPDGRTSDIIYFLFGHLDEIGIQSPTGIIDYEDIVVGETKVKRGWRIGSVGAVSGGSPHLHLECFTGYSSANPLGTGYYTSLPDSKYDALEFIANNRSWQVQPTFYVHNYSQQTSGYGYVQLLTGDWIKKTGYQEPDHVPLGYNNLLYVSSTNVDNQARWRLHVPIDGQYEVAVHIPNFHYTSQRANYRLERSSYPPLTFVINGLPISNDWVLLGKYDFKAQDDNSVWLSSATTEDPPALIAVDAVKLNLKSGTGGFTANKDDPPLVPDNLALSVYPNPFNGQTNIRLEVPVAGEYTVRAYDILGQLVDEVYSGSLSVGRHEFTWPPTSLGGGVYLLHVVGSRTIRSNKLVYLP
ncbi:MAG: T9SS type A sorting domain-containing protein, partial [Candidatus Komeilibacteria bacterium]|nr:T9SS type A sorting domain-containing protein [Candidatus Komeilibacteria bacterium]